MCNRLLICIMFCAMSSVCFSQSSNSAITKAMVDKDAASNAAKADVYIHNKKIIADTITVENSKTVSPKRKKKKG